jgi:hypothetical protein
MPAVGSPEPTPGCDNSNDWIEKAPSLIYNVGQSFVMGIGQVALKRCGSTASIGRIEMKTGWPPSGSLQDPTTHPPTFSTASVTSAVASEGSINQAFRWPKALCAGLCFAWPLSGWCAFHHSRNSILVPMVHPQSSTIVTTTVVIASSPSS